MKKIFFGEWLAKALTISLFVVLITVSLTVLGDMLYNKEFTKRQTAKINPKEALREFAPKPTSIAIVPQVTDTPQFVGQFTTTPTQTPTPKPTTKATGTPKPTATKTPTPTTPFQSGNTSTPTHTNTPTATTAPPSGCFVIVSGYLYNMQSGIGTVSTDPNTGKTHIHTTIDYTCGTQSNPTDMTDTYLDKHGPMGCAPRLAPYIVTPPAPADPTC